MSTEPRKTSDYNLFRKWLVANGMRLKPVDVGLSWEAMQAKSGAGTVFSEWMKRTTDLNDAPDEKSSKDTTKYDLNSLVGKVKAMTRTSDSIKAKLRILFADTAESRANDIRSGVSSAKDVIQPSSTLANPLQDNISQAFSDATGGYGIPGFSIPGTYSTGGASGDNNIGGRGFQNYPGQEQLGRGPARFNAGGGAIDTEIENTETGDVVVRGPQSVDVHKTNLAAEFQQASGEDVTESPADEHKDVVQAETWNWVPPGEHNFGPHDPVHLLNEQHSFIRYGSDKLAMPRSYEFHDGPFHPEGAWINHREPQILENDFRMIVDRSLSEKHASLVVRKRPLEMLEEDVNRELSAKGLRREVPDQHLENIYQTAAEFLPVREPCGLFLQNRPFRDSVRGTWRSVL